MQLAAESAPRCLEFRPERFGILVLFEDDLAPEFLSAIRFMYGLSGPGAQGGGACFCGGDAG